MSADDFSCPTCHLVLDRYELIEQAGLPATFDVIDDDPLWRNRSTATTNWAGCAGRLTSLTVPMVQQFLNQQLEKGDSVRKV